MKHLAVHKSRPTLSAQKASVPGWEAVLSQGKIKVSCLGLNPRLSSRLWERSIEFQGKAIQSRGERTRGKDEGRLGWKKWKEKANEGERGKTWSGDVWRFPRVAESIRPRLSALLLLFLPLAPGVDKTPQTPDAYAGKVPTPTTQYASDSPYSTPHLSPSAPPHQSLLSEVSCPISPCSSPPSKAILAESICLPRLSYCRRTRLSSVISRAPVFSALALSWPIVYSFFVIVSITLKVFLSSFLSLIIHDLPSLSLIIPAVSFFRAPPPHTHTHLANLQVRCTGCRYQLGDMSECCD